MEQLDYLWDYQKLDLKIDEVENEKKSSSARKELYGTIKYIKNQQKNLVKLNNDVDKKNHIYNRIYHEFENINNSLEEEEELIANGEISSFKHLDQIEKRILAAQEKLNEKGKELTILLKDMEDFNKKLQDISIRLRKGKKEYDISKKKYDIEIKELESEAKKIKSQKEALKGKIEKSLLTKYETVRGNHAVVMAEVDDDRCGGCNMMLASLVIQNVRDKASIIDCENCGRILYSGSNTSNN